jgi:hypothetical protein
LRNTEQVHTSTSRRYLKRRKPRDRSSETEGGVLCCDSTGKWGLEAIGEGGIFRRTPAAAELSMDGTDHRMQSWTASPGGREACRLLFWPPTIHLSPAAHMGTVDQLTTGQFQFMSESPMLLLAIRWAHAHDNPSPPMLHPIPRRRIIRE